MKKLYITFILINLINGFSFAQEMKINAKSVVKSYENKGMSKSDILTKVQTWFNEELDPEKNVIEIFDTGKGMISIKGETNVLYKNIGKELYPKRSGMAEVLEARFGHRLDVQANQDDYVITYSVTDMKQEMYKKQDLFFDCVNFEQIDEKSLAAYNKAMNNLLKANLVFKKRRDIFMGNSKSQFEEVSNFLRNEGETLIFSVNEAITTE